MAVTPDKVQIGNSSDYLDGVAVDTSAGAGLFRETVVLADPEDGDALANVRLLNEPLLATDRGIVTHSVIQGFSTSHGGEFHDVKVTPSGALTVESTVTGTVSIAGTVNIAEPVTVDGAVTAFSSLVPVAYNEISLSYTGANLTGVIYKQSGSTVATLTLGYNGDNLTSVVRT